jgi:thiazole tautomerase (transcriptional regulator TenI)
MQRDETASPVFLLIFQTASFIGAVFLYLPACSMEGSVEALKEIHLISDGRLNPEQFAELAAAVHYMVDYIHLREKTMSARELLTAAERLLTAGVPSSKLVINDRMDVALAAGAAGAQLAWHSLAPATARGIAPGLRLGRSVHSAEEAAQAGRQGADYCLYGHVFPTACKPGQRERGLEQLAEAVCCCSIPLIAVGGITPDNTFCRRGRPVLP